MEDHLLVWLCFAILAISGCFDGMSDRLGIEKRDIIFTAAAVIAMSGFTVAPVRALTIGLDVPALPAVLFALGTGRDKAAAKLFAKLGAVSLIPIIVGCLLMLAEYLYTGYLYFEAEEKYISLVQTMLVCIVVTLRMSAGDYRQKET